MVKDKRDKTTPVFVSVDDAQWTGGEWSARTCQPIRAVHSDNTVQSSVYQAEGHH